MRKIMLVLGVGLLLMSVSFSMEPKVEYHGLFYIYNFMWYNADFQSSTKDGDQHYYIHGDFTVDVDFGDGISTHAAFGGWGCFGMHAITGAGPMYGGTPGEKVALRELYITVANLFNKPLSFRIGKEHVLYGDQVFDGGEDGFMGVKFSYNTDAIDIDLFSYRLEEGGGTALIGAMRDSVPSDWNLYGLWSTFKLGEKSTLSAYGFCRKLGAYHELETWYYPQGTKDSPKWLGLRHEASPIEGLDYVVEFSKMMGNQEGASTINYTGMHYMARLSYTPTGTPFTFGGAYVSFAGDDTATADDELYESPTWGPYTFGFYKAWPGFGPAHLLRTGFGFSLLAPWEAMVTNLNVINFNAQYKKGPLTLRADVFNYSRNMPEAGNAETAMGKEVALLATYSYKGNLDVGATIGYWIPGKYFGTGLSPMLGGYFFTAKSF
ncbi:MAG TPA: hypothetical protein EYP60_00345 [bacterium (Candidatus Stahlbacteria)]|nr:hypothetical protein [Candidatus Stahlbacteria bacterium]